MTNKLLRRLKGRESQTAKQYYTACVLIGYHLCPRDSLWMITACMPRWYAQCTVEGHCCKHEGQKENAFSKANKRAEMLRHPCIVAGPQRQAQGENENRLPHPCLLGCRKGGTNAMSPQDSRGFANKGGQNQNWLPHPYLLKDPKERGNATPPLHSWGFANKGGQNQKWLPQPCLFRGPEESRNAMAPLHSWGYPNKAGQNQKWLDHPCLLQGPKGSKQITRLDNFFVTRVYRKKKLHELQHTPTGAGEVYSPHGDFGYLSHG